MTDPPIRLDGTLPARLSSLLLSAKKERGETFEGLGELVGMYRETMSERVKSGDGWRLDDLIAVTTHLAIPMDVVAETLFPDRSAPISVARLEHQLRVLEDEVAQLRKGRYEPHNAIRDVLLTGQWSVSVLPLMTGPAPGRQVLSSVYLTVAPLAPAPEDTAQTIRARLAERVPSLYRRAAVLSGGATRLPKLPGVRGTDDGASLSLSIPVFTADRDMAPPSLRTAVRYSGQGLLVVASTNTSGAREISALVSRALGWGLTSTRTLARILPPQIDNWEGPAHRKWLREEANRQLEGLLFGEQREKHHVYCHWDHAATADGAVQHPLIDGTKVFAEAAEKPGPFVVFLNEDGKVLEDASDKPYQDPSGTNSGTERNTQLLNSITRNRDALRRVIPDLPAERRLIVPVRAVPASSDPEERVQRRWQRHVTIAGQILEHLKVPVEGLRIADIEARTVLKG